MSDKLDFDPLSIQAHGGTALESVDAVMERLEFRRANRVNLDVDRFRDLNVRWIDQDPSHSKAGWYAKVDGQDLRFSDNAVKTASKLVKQANVEYWDQFPDRNAFPTTLSHVLDNRRNTRLLVRHDGLEINAVLPPQYRIRDAAELMSDFLPSLKDQVGEIHGCSVLEEGSGDIYSIRIVCGQNIVPSLQSQYGQFMMFLLATSETGAMETATALGLFRSSCTNSAIREKLVSKWNHRGKADNFFDKTGERLRMAGYYQGAYARIFGELLNTKLDVAPRDLLTAFASEKLISSGHYDAARMYIDTPTEDGRPVETQYDMFNVLTRGARDMLSIQARQLAESRSLHLFTEPGGIFERLRDAAEERAKQGAMRRGSDTTFDDAEADEE